MARILVFDVNETLLDLSALDAPFADVFGDASMRHRWFQELLHQALVTTVTGPYVDFGTLAMDALAEIAAGQRQTLSPGDKDVISEALRTLPPHPDVAPALDLLEQAGRRMVALSNGTPDALTAQLDHAGLTDRFAHVVSADAAGWLKPAPEPYEYVADLLDVATDDLRMIAAHAWDTTGAQRAGCAAAFVARPGKRLRPSDPVPDVIGDTLVDVAERLVDGA